MLASGLAFVEVLKDVDCKPGIVQLAIDTDDQGAPLVYTSAKLPASVGLELMPRVTTLIGSALTRSVVTGDGAFDATVIVRIADRAMHDGLVPLVRDLLQRVQVSRYRGGPGGGRLLPKFDDHFAGE